jgi:hypothetical protein
MLRRIALLLCLAGPAIAQETPATTAGMNVYLDCQTFGCDFDYFRTELTMVNWVRDRQVADLQLLVTSQETGAGGSEFTVTFLGLRQFAGLNDTLRYVAPPASSQDDIRKGLGGIFRLGFVRYFARTPAGARLTVAFGDTGQKGPAVQPKDPWNGFTSAEETFKQYDTQARLSADRVTEKWKTRVSGSSNYFESRNTYPVCSGTPQVCVDTTDINYRRGYEVSILQVRSIGAHLSAGLRVGTFSSTYENYRQVIRAFPAIQYNFFPWSQSTRRQLTAEYNIGYGVYRFSDTTAFDKMEQSMPIQRFLAGMKTREPWGSIDVGVNAINYLNDRSLYRIGAFAELSLRLFKGFEIGGFGSYDRIRDQFNLRKKDLSPEDILTRQFQVGTGYSFFGHMYLRYTFGSIFNNVVNPRMEGGGF